MKGVPERILVVDSDRDTADATVQKLCSLGVFAEACYSAAECLERIADFRPAIVFLDENMAEFCGEIRAPCKPADVHIVGLRARLPLA